MSRDPAGSHLVCVVPMYNEAGHAADFVRALHARVAPRVGSVTLVVVDDGSRDSTADAVLAVSDVPLCLLRLSRNFGKEAALAAGLARAEALEPALVLVIDGDFQHPLPVIDRMLEIWQGGVDMVYGVQQRDPGDSRLKRGFTALFYRLMRIGERRVDIPADAGDFRLFDRRVLQALNRLPERSRYMKGLFAWVGFSSQGVAFRPEPRASGQSTFDLRGLGGLALDGLTAFTTWPLRVASLTGGLISLAAFLYGCWIVLEWFLIGQPIVGFATLAAAIMFFSGVQLLSIGLLGEYLARVFTEVKGRPLYIVADEQIRSGSPMGRQ